MSAQGVVYAAQSQVGYLEKKNNAYLENFTANAGNGNYTKYGAWFGLNPAEWCDMFVCWCAAQAGEDVGKYAYVPAHVQHFKDMEQYFARGSNVAPEPGDVIFFEYGYDGAIDGDHVGLVEECDGYNVYTIEGNTKNVQGIGGVFRHTYNLANTNILGYGRPDYSGEKEKDLRVFNPWKTYKNGSTEETVYKDTGFTTDTGSLNPYEECYCTGRYGNAYAVLYKMDGTDDDWAMGYVRYNGGITD